MMYMAKPKKNAGRTGRSVTLFLDPEVHEAMTVYRNQERFTPSQTQVIELALKEFLERQGFWPVSKRN